MFQIVLHYYSINQLELRQGLISIGEEAFIKCKSITSLTIPSSVTSIGKNAFIGCRQLVLRVPRGIDIRNLGHVKQLIKYSTKGESTSTGSSNQGDIINALNAMARIPFGVRLRACSEMMARKA